MHGLQIAADRLGPERHGAVDPGADPGGAPALDVAAEAGRNFERGVEFAALHALFQIRIIGERRPFREIGRAPQLFEIGAALVTLVVVQNGEGEVVDVRRDAEAEHQHQESRAEERESRAGSDRAGAPEFRGWNRRTAAAG